MEKKNKNSHDDDNDDHDHDEFSLKRTGRSQPADEEQAHLLQLLNALLHVRKGQAGKLHDCCLRHAHTTQLLQHAKLAVDVETVAAMKNTVLAQDPRQAAQASIATQHLNRVKGADILTLDHRERERKREKGWGRDRQRREQE